MRWWKLGLGIVLALAAESLEAFGGTFGHWASLILSIFAIVLAGWGTYLGGWKSIFRLELNMNALMTIAVTGGVLLGSWPEAAMVMVLFTLAEEIEEISLAKAKKAVGNLVESAPLDAMVKQADGAWSIMPVKSIATRQMLRIKPGERLALDGVITRGSPSINQAAITGESLPIDKAVGDEVFAGTLNQSGEFEMQVTHSVEQTLLARIQSSVETALANKANAERFIDRFARIYTPAVFVVAIFVAIIGYLFLGASWHDWIYRSLVILVIACPCALVISTPVSIVSGLTSAAKRGILVKGGQFLEQARSLSMLALDKTGTITQGKPQVQRVLHFNENHDVSLSWAKSLAERSDHPLSKAIARYISNESNPIKVENFSASPGKGVSGCMNGKTYYLGNYRWIHENGIVVSDLASQQINEMESADMSLVLLGEESTLLVAFALADAIKPQSIEAIQQLQQRGVQLQILSGDSMTQVQRVAETLGIGEAKGNLLPDDKFKTIAALTEQKTKGIVGMVGDGINDAPALARSDMGFAMGASGSDTAIETADVAIMDDDLRKIPVLMDLSRHTYAILWQNIVFAIGIKALFLILTLMGLTNMWEAVFADTGVSLLVIINALRLLKK